jgi:VWFA-related protein
MGRSACRVVWVVVVAVAAAWAGAAFAQADITVIVNDVEAQPIEGELAYQVTAYVTAADSDGLPITGLSEGAFTVSEDGQPVALESVEMVERSATIVLVIDTSGSMTSGNAMEAVREAATGFVNSLGAGDQIGLISFNDTVTIAQNLSDDLPTAASIITGIEAESGAGTCLYDAAYDALTMATSAPPGQRAVVLLTDGIDEQATSDEPCSAHTVEDVIGLATGGVTRVPIYTIGLGDRVDAAELSRISESTNGSSLIAPGPEDVAALFQAVAAQLKNQYALTYRSETASGEHNLTVVIQTNDAIAIGASRFVAPSLLGLSGLDSGAILEGSRVIRATVSGGAEVVGASFTLDGQALAEIPSAPFEITLDAAALAPGEHELVATTTLSDGTVLTAALSFEVQVAQPETTGEETTEQPLEDTGWLSTLPAWALPAGIVGAVLILGGGAAVVLFAVIGVGRKERRRGGGAAAGGYAAPGDMTTDIRVGPTLATLIVQESLSLAPGQRLDMTQEVTRLGRGVENEMVIPDAPVSRMHAEIRFVAGAFRVYDMGSTFGTFVNDESVGSDGHPIQHGDTLRLGTRTAFTFTTPQGAGDDQEYITVEVAGEEDTDEFATTGFDDTQ